MNNEQLALKGRFEVVARRKDGSIKWREVIDNLIVNAGKNYILDAGLSAGTPITTWYVGLTTGSPSPAAGDTMSSHAGWTEFTNYDEANRQTWTDGGVSGQSVDNSASPAVFTSSGAAQTVGGMFLTSDNTKSGTTGTLFSAGAFSGGNKTLETGETITVTYTVNA